VTVVEGTQETEIQLTPKSAIQVILSMYSSAAVLENKLALEELVRRVPFPPEIVISHVL
jgi:hypothetical protein